MGERVRAALALRCVRLLLAVFLTGTAVALAFVVESARLRTEMGVLASARHVDELLDGVDAAMTVLERRLGEAAAGAPVGDLGPETEAARSRLASLAEAAAASSAAGEVPTAGILDLLDRVAALGAKRGAGEAPRAALVALRDRVEVDWERFHGSVHETTTRAAAVRALEISERASAVRWALMVVGLLAAAALAFGVWQAGGGVLALREQFAAVAGQDYDAAGEWIDTPGDLREQRFSLGAVSSSLAVAARYEDAARGHRERFDQRLAAAVDAIASGDLERPLPPADVPGADPVLAALERLVAVLRGRREAERAERGRLAGQTPVPTEELSLLQGLFDLDPARQEQAAAAFGSDSPLAPVGIRAVELAARSRGLETSLRSRAAGIVSEARALAEAVRVREEEFRSESLLIHETSTTVNEVSVAARQTAQMVEFVFRSSQEAMEAAEGGRVLVQRTLAGMEKIAERVGRIAEQILELQARSQEIGAIVRAIGEVAKQTNLLALNAAIEAAGAGEHGRGFAVVAKEIRELAVKSARSTQDIQRIIQEIQAATNAAVLSTEEGSKSVQEGVGHANQFREAFGEIVARFQEVVESAQQISTAAQEQTAGARQVATSIGTIDRMVRGTVEDLQGMQHMLEQYNAVSRELAAALGADGGDGAA